MFASGIVLRVTPVHTAVHNCKLAARITIPHFSVSSVRCFPKSDGEPANTTEPSSVSRALSLGSAAREFHGFLPFAHCNDREFCTSVSRAALRQNTPLPETEKGWKGTRPTGFPNRHLRDSWVVGFWRTDHAHHHDGRGLDNCLASMRGIALKAWRQRAR